MSDGIFTQPGPDGIFGRHQGGEPLDATSATIDSDGQNLRDTLVAVFPSPGHMRVARATRNVKTGHVEKHEEYREPTPQERAILAQQGVFPPPGPPAPMPVAFPPAPTALVAPQLGNAGDKPADAETPWFKLAIAAAVGAAGLWATQTWVMPMLSKGSGPEPDDEGGDEE
jgi:hypothetical protein